MNQQCFGFLMWEDRLSIGQDEDALGQVSWEAGSQFGLDIGAG